jgi:hypothetical protein
MNFIYIKKKLAKIKKKLAEIKKILVKKKIYWQKNYDLLVFTGQKKYCFFFAEILVKKLKYYWFFKKTGF